MRSRSTILLIGIVAFIARAGIAQLTTIEDYHGRKIACSVSGLRGGYTFCGIDKTRGYASIFTGSIITITPVKEGGDNEFRLLVQPEEVFLGTPESQLSVTTRRGECIDHDFEFHAGDRWLFYIRTDEKSGEPLLWFGTESAPLDQSNQLNLLRLQKEHPDAGFITGYVSKVADNKSNDDYTAQQVKDHVIRITSRSDKVEQTTASDGKGRFQFPPLAPGNYDLTGNTTAGLWAEDVTVDVHAASCADVPIELAPDSAISGRVFDVNGKPIQYASVEVAPFYGPLGAGDALTKADGSYEIHGLAPGRYYVGIGIHAPDDPSTAFTVFYPNSQTQQTGVAIILGKNEHRDHIDFHLTRPFKR